MVTVGGRDRLIPGADDPLGDRAGGWPTATFVGNCRVGANERSPSEEHLNSRHSRYEAEMVLEGLEVPGKDNTKEATGAQYSAALAQSGYDVAHVLENVVSEDDVETLIVKRKRLGTRDPEVGLHTAPFGKHTGTVY